ncbi:MAG: serine/threonine protein kinase [Planctomyces sp.]|nr:serine/threonine protein kinase [Planctomyces sp.]
MTPTDHQNDTPDLPEGALSNTRLGEFLLLRRLGSGGMADVYLAEQTSLGRPVAVKVLKADAITDQNGVMLKRFEQEARAAGGLNHPHIVQILTTGRDGNVSYIVQEYVPGVNLSQWIRKNGSPDFRTGLTWMRQIAGALKAANEAGIVHRDVKPENIMVTRTQTAKVTDFGLAQLAQQSDGKMNLTQIGTTMGTPWYMSPEQIQGEKLDHRSDQYSFGITCFHMFAGRPPFPGKNAVTVAVQHLKEEPPALSAIRADLPKQLCDIIHRMMAKKVSQRFQTSDELEAALAALENVSVNENFTSSKGLLSRLRPYAPGMIRLGFTSIAALLICFVIARNASAPVSVPDLKPKADFRTEATAGAQYAAAIINPKSEIAWQKVIERFPGTYEADMAQLRLGLMYLDPPVPQYEKSMDVFRSIEDAGSSPEKRYLKALGILGQAYVLNREGKRADTAPVLQRLQYVFDGIHREEELDAAIEEGPQELRDFYRGGNGGFFGRQPG